MAEGVNKDYIKSFLEKDNDIVKKLKECMVTPNNWKEFRSQLASAVEKFSKDSTLDSREAIYELVSNNLKDKTIGDAAIDALLFELGISRDVEFSSSKNGKNVEKKSNEAHLRDIYDRLGIPFPNDALKAEEERQKKANFDKYGIDEEKIKAQVEEWNKKTLSGIIEDGKRKSDKILNDAEQEIGSQENQRDNSEQNDKTFDDERINN